MAEDATEQALMKAARKIRHSGDYGLLFFNTRTGAVHWTGGDADSPPEYTSMDDVKRILSRAPGVTKVQIGDEWSPEEHEGWQRLEYRQGRDNPYERDMDAMVGAIGKEFGDLGVGVDIEGEPLTRPSKQQTGSRIDQLLAQIGRETDPAREAELKREALRLMAQESTPQEIVRRLLG